MTTIATPAGELTLERRYDLTVEPPGGLPREVKNAKLVAVDQRVVGHCSTCTCLEPEEPAYELHPWGFDDAIGVVPEHITSAKARR